MEDFIFPLFELAVDFFDTFLSFFIVILSQAPRPLSQSDLQRVHGTPTKIRVAEMSTVGQADIHLGGQGSQMTIRFNPQLMSSLNL
jgi:hypothetical protein